MKKILVVVDMQNDFVDGSLGTKEAVSIVPNVAKKIREFDGDEIFVTYDTHHENYLETLEGKKLPVIHCIEGSHGHELHPEVKDALNGKKYSEVYKAGFGSFSLTRGLKDKYPGEEMEFEIVGLCTDVCVVSNAIIIRAGYPNSRITVDADCCAGITPQLHEAALETMKSCQIDITHGRKLTEEELEDVSGGLAGLTHLKGARLTAGLDTMLPPHDGAGFGGGDKMIYSK